MPDNPFADPRLAALRELLNVRPKVEEYGGNETIYPKLPTGLPPVAKPPMFRPYPKVTGSPQLARDLDSLLRVAPELQGQLKAVDVMGPHFFQMISELGDNPSELLKAPWATNLAGTTNVKVKEIGMNPILMPITRADIHDPLSMDEPARSETYEQLPVLAHELAHVAGHMEAKADEAAQLAHPITGLIRSLRNRPLRGK